MLQRKPISEQPPIKKKMNLFGKRSSTKFDINQHLIKARANIDPEKRNASASKTISKYHSSTTKEFKQNAAKAIQPTAVEKNKEVHKLLDIPEATKKLATMKDLKLKDVTIKDIALDYIEFCKKGYLPMKVCQLIAEKHGLPTLTTRSLKEFGRYHPEIKEAVEFGKELCLMNNIDSLKKGMRLDVCKYVNNVFLKTFETQQIKGELEVESNNNTTITIKSFKDVKQPKSITKG